MPPTLFSRLRRYAHYLALVAVLLASSVQADEPALRKVVLQLTDASLEKQVLVLNVADNLVARYGDRLRLEVVAFGPGLELLMANNPNDARISQLAGQGVRFSACGNTQRRLAKLTGVAPSLISVSDSVDSGAGRIIELVEQGYVLLRP